MHSCLPHLYCLSVILLVSPYLFSYSSHFQTKQHNFLSWPLQKLLYQFSYSQQRLNISVISSFLCEACYALQGRFALPVYLQDLYFPFTSSISLWILESSFGSLCSSNNVDHTRSTQMTNSFLSLAFSRPPELPSTGRAVRRSQAARPAVENPAVTSRLHCPLEASDALGNQTLTAVFHAHLGSLKSFALICYQSIWGGFVCLQHRQWHVRRPRQKPLIAVVCAPTACNQGCCSDTVRAGEHHRCLSRHGKGSRWNRWRKGEISCQRPVCWQWRNYFFPVSLCHLKQDVWLL